MRSYGAELGQKVVMRDVLKRGLSLFPDRAALLTFEGELSWRALDRLSDAYAANLLARGLAPGDRIASFLPNSGTQFIHYLALLKSGLIAVPLNYRYTAQELDHALKVSGANAIVYHSGRRADVAGSQRAAELELLFHHGGGEGVSAASTPVEALMEDSVLAVDPPRPDKPAVIFFTSGSTGPAKGVTHTHKTLGWILASNRAALQFSPDDRLLGGTSASHVGGYTVSLGCLSQGGMVILPRAGDVQELITMMRTHRPTMIGMVPSAHFNVIRSEYLRPGDFSSLRLVASAGDTVPEQLQAEFMAVTGLPIAQVYGMTESPTSLVNPSAGLVRHDSVGRASPGYVCELRDDGGRPVPVGEEGRLFVRSKGSMAYYWNDPDATRQVYDDEGWLDTGDIMRADEQGFYYFCGRRKQIIVHDGSNIFPQEVEDALLGHDAVQMAGVVGVADTVHGETVCAYVELKAGAASVSTLELIEFARARVGYKAPEIIHIIDKVPLNPTGKVDRVSLKKTAAAAMAVVHH